MPHADKAVKVQLQGYSVLEGEFCRELDLPGIELTKCCAKVRLIDNAAHQVEVRVIWKIEKLCAELRADALRDTECPGDGRV